jgi:4-hydroxy-tetrahydrodipicolinate synthase
MESITGTGVALITPFKKDLSVDTEALERIVNYQIEGGIDYLVVLGTTAESATLDKAEKALVIQTVIKANAGRLPLVLGIGGNNTKEVAEEIKATDLAGFVAILSVSPFYNKPTQEGIYQHFKAVAQACPLPIILYNVPGRTASNMLPQTVLRLANDFDNIVAIKEAAGDIVQAMKIIQNKPEGFLVISGDDMITLPMVLAGGAGVISVIAEGFPHQFSQMVRHGLNRNVDEAYRLHYEIADSIDMIFEQGNPAGIKHIFKELGLCQDFVRLPLVSIDQGLAQRLAAFVAKNKVAVAVNQ